MIREVGVNANSSLIRERPDLFNAAVEGISDVIRLQGVQPIIFGPHEDNSRIIDEVELPSFDHSRSQLQLECMADNLLIAKPDLAMDRPEYILTDRDMYGGELRFALGYAMADRDLSIQSIARLIQVERSNGEPCDPYEQYLAVRHIARHEFGHVLGLRLPQDYDNPDLGVDYHAGHCNNACTMRQVDNAPETFDLAIYLERSGLGMAGFCASCVASIRRKAFVNQPY
jgi:hypothetical protein